jgi:hypothetical protein
MDAQWEGGNGCDELVMTVVVIWRPQHSPSLALEPLMQLPGAGMPRPASQVVPWLLGMVSVTLLLNVSRLQDVVVGAE